MRVWAAATDTDAGFQIEIFTSEEAMEDFLIEQIVGTGREHWKASGLCLQDYLQENFEDLDTWTWTYEDIEP